MNLRANMVELGLGDFFYVREPKTGAVVGMMFSCPCGCGRVEGVGFSDKPPKRKGFPSWQWDGNFEKPTLTPSLGLGVTYKNRVPSYHWHGYLTAGEFHDGLHDGTGRFLVTDDGQRITV